MFDSMSNYLFCQECVVKALRVSKQRLAHQRSVRRNTFQHPIKRMVKSEVETKGLKSFVVMPDGLTTPLNVWWQTLPLDHEIDVRFPYERHGLSGHISNNAKMQAKADFLMFVDDNCQPNGRRMDSRNPTHYFLPNYTTISTPKKNDPNRESKLKKSLVAEFNRIQAELNRDTISDFTANAWLKSDRAKYAIYPHQVDYCDFCAIRKKDIQTKQQVINRIRQSGNATDELRQAEAEKSEIEKELEEHKDAAQKSLSFYRNMKEKCKKLWTQIEELQEKSRTPDEEQDLQRQKHAFTLVLSADHQMSKVLPYWGESPQPALQK